jgi:hypothetical protein
MAISLSIFPPKQPPRKSKSASQKRMG